MLHRLLFIVSLSLCGLNFFFFTACHATNNSFTASFPNISFDFEKEIADITNPTYEEYKKIEQYLSQITDEGLPYTQTRRHAKALNSMRLVGENGEMPISEVIYLNNKPKDRHNCIILYASYNPPYPEGIYHFIEALKEIGFDGHVIYHIGGYPGLKKGFLKLIDVPHAFKFCAFQEAADLGYQNILWIDAMLTPIRSLAPLFRRLDKKGSLLLRANQLSCCVNPIQMLHVDHLKAVGISLETAAGIFQCQGTVIGINSNTDQGKIFLSELASLALNTKINRFIFCSGMIEEFPVSIAAYKAGIKDSLSPFLLLRSSHSRFFDWSDLRPSHRAGIGFNVQK